MLSLVIIGIIVSRGYVRILTSSVHFSVGFRRLPSEHDYLYLYFSEEYEDVEDAEPTLQTDEISEVTVTDSGICANHGHPEDLRTVTTDRDSQCNHKLLYTGNTMILRKFKSPLHPTHPSQPFLTYAFSGALVNFHRT